VRRLLAVAVLGIAILALGAGNARAAFISLVPEDVSRSIDEADPTVTFALNLNMAGETSGVAYADVFISFSDPTLYQAGSLSGQENASSQFESLSYNVNAQGDQISFHATSEVFNPVPTLNGDEIFYLGDIVFQHAGVLGILDVLLDLNQTSIASIDPFTFEYIQYSLDNTDAVVGTLQFAQGSQTPEPAAAALLLLGLLGIAQLRMRSRAE
jgi:hypothetical protein